MKITDPKKTWVISDFHFAHENIIKYCNRPFKSVTEMDMRMINNYNSLVDEKDEVFILGDVTYSWEQAKFYLSQLNGFIHVLPGNHDFWHKFQNRRKMPLYSKSSLVAFKDHIIELELPQYKTNGHNKSVILCHYPIESWDKKYHNSWHLFGHVHNNRPNLEYQLGLAKNVCVEMTGYKPVSLHEIATELLKRENYKRDESTADLYI